MSPHVNLPSIFRRISTAYLVDTDLDGRLSGAIAHGPRSDSIDRSTWGSERAHDPFTTHSIRSITGPKMASSPITSHSRHKYSAGPSRLRISQSFPNLGRQASSSATPGRGLGSSPPKKRSLHSVRPDVTFIPGKFRSSSSAPNGNDEQLHPDRQKLYDQLKIDWEAIQVRYREHDAEDEVDLTSMKRYTPDGRVEAWRPDGPRNGGGVVDHQEPDDDDNDEDDEGATEPETDDHDGSGGSGDELGDWGEQEEALRRELSERQASIARLSDPF